MTIHHEGDAKLAHQQFEILDADKSTKISFKMIYYLSLYVAIMIIENQYKVCKPFIYILRCSLDHISKHALPTLPPLRGGWSHIDKNLTILTNSVLNKV